MTVPSPWQQEHNLVRSLDFIEWATRSGYVRDYTSPVVDLTTARQTALELTVPDGSTFYAIESMVTVLGDLPCRQYLEIREPGASTWKPRMVLVSGAEGTDFRRLIRRKLKGGTGYRVLVASSPTNAQGKPKPGANQAQLRWTFLEVPWVDDDA